MTKFVYALRDVKTGYLDPFVAVSDAVAIRSFASSLITLRDTASDLWHFADDFELWVIGTFNTETAQLSTDERIYPDLVASVASIKQSLLRGDFKDENADNV